MKAVQQRLGGRLGVVLGLAALVAALPLVVSSPYHLRVAALVWIFGLAAIGLNLLMGYAGQVSLGHGGFLGLGAYAVAIGPVHLGLPGWAALLAGAALSAIVAFVVGRPMLRLRGHYLAVGTLGFGLLVAMVLANESAWTGGPDGMAAPRLTILGWAARGAQTWYWLSGGVLVAAAWLAASLIESPTGRALRAIHDSEIASSIAGVDVARYKLVAFVVSAVYASVAGSMLALLNGHVTPDAGGFLRSLELVTMVVLGGLGSIVGSVVGAAFLVILPQALTAFHDYEHMVLGLLMMLSMIFMRRGIVPSLRALAPSRAS